TAAAIGLTIVAVAFRVLREYLKHSPDMADRAPFWFGPGMVLSAGTIVYVAVLAVLAALVIGALPALKATGRNVQTRLQQFSSRGSGLQLGRTWTVLIVVQVAIAVAVLPGALQKTQQRVSMGFRAPAPAANDMLRGTLAMPQGTEPATAWAARFTARMTVLMQRLTAEPQVAAVTFAQDFPGKERYALVEAEPSVTIEAASTRIATNLFDVFDVHPIAGRGFVAADAR